MKTNYNSYLDCLDDNGNVELRKIELSENFESNEISLKDEFYDLYNIWVAGPWQYSTYESAKYDKNFDNLKEWAIRHKKVSIECIKEILSKEPNYVIEILPELLHYNIFSNNRCNNGYNYSLIDECNIWLNVLNNTNDIDYYKDYKKWKKHLKYNHYSWNPNKEKDPNVTLKDYKKGKRNKRSIKNIIKNLIIDI